MRKILPEKPVEWVWTVIGAVVAGAVLAHFSGYFDKDQRTEPTALVVEKQPQAPITDPIVVTPTPPPKPVEKLREKSPIDLVRFVSENVSSSADFDTTTKRIQSIFNDYLKGKELNWSVVLFRESRKLDMSRSQYSHLTGQHWLFPSLYDEEVTPEEAYSDEYDRMGPRKHSYALEIYSKNDGSDFRRGDTISVIGEIVDMRLALYFERNNPFVLEIKIQGNVSRKQ